MFVLDFIFSPYLPIMSLLNRQFLSKKTTCSSSLLQPSQKAFAGPSGPQTLAVYPPAALPLPVYECSSFGKSFLLDSGESKKQGGASTALYISNRLILFAGRDSDEKPLRPRDVTTRPALTSLDSTLRTCESCALTLAVKCADVTCSP